MRVLGLAIIISGVSAFVPQVHSVHRTSVVPKMGIFDVFKNAFANELFDDRRVKASHILVKTEDEAAELLQKIESTELTFADAAREFSSCPSGKAGGSLGAFGPGKMVKEFDQVCFDESVEPLSVVGPVKTAFGYHLIKIDERFKNNVQSEGSSVF